MKKSHLITGIVYVLVGIVFLVAALFTETKINSLLFGFTGACIGPGILMICKYFYWSSPKNKAVYEEKLERERIELHDEMKNLIRCKTAMYLYVAGLFIISFSMVVFSVLDSLEILKNGNIFVFYLAGYMAFQIIGGIVIYKHIMKKY